MPWHILAPRRGCFSNHLPLRRVRILAEHFYRMETKFPIRQKKSLSKNQRTAFAQALLCRNIPASQVCPFPRRHDKKATLKTQSSFSMFLIQLSSFNPAGLQAACANVHSPCTTVDFTFNASDVGIPDTVGSSMGMAYVVTEMSAFATNIAFCHDCTSSNYIRRLTDNISMITELNTFGK